MTIFHVPDVLAKNIEERARAAGWDRDVYACELLMAAMEEEDDFALLRSRLANPGKRFSLDEVERELGLAD